MTRDSDLLLFWNEVKFNQILWNTLVSLLLIKCKMWKKKKIQFNFIRSHSYFNMNESSTYLRQHHYVKKIQIGIFFTIRYQGRNQTIDKCWSGKLIWFNSVPVSLFLHFFYISIYLSFPSCFLWYLGFNKYTSVSILIWFKIEW